MSRWSNTGAVQRNERGTLAMLDVVNSDFVNLVIHVATPYPDVGRQTPAYECTPVMKMLTTKKLNRIVDESESAM